LKPELLDPEERIFTLSDVRRLFQSQKRTLCLIALVCATCVFGLQLLRTPKYLAEATFKEGVEKTDEGGLKELLGGFGMGPQQPQAVVLMKSHQVLKPLAERFGLQVSVKRPGFLGKIFRRMTDNWRAERENPLSELDWFEFENVRYNGEQKKTYGIRFTDPQHFEILDGGKPVHNLALTCTKTPSNLRLHKIYTLTLTPWIDAVGALRKSLKITSHKTNKSIYDLSLEHRDRMLAARLLNGLMEEYQHYLKKEHDQTAATQVAYLEKKQSQIYDQMGHVFDEHAVYLKNALRTNGFIGLKEGIESFLEMHENMRSKLVNIDLELAQLETEPACNLSLPGSEFSRAFFTTLEHKRSLEQERNLLELALHDKAPANLETVFQELSAVRMQKQEVKQQLEQNNYQPPLPGPKILLNVPSSKAI